MIRFFFHKKDNNTMEGKKFTRGQRKKSQAEFHQSALTDHIASENHTIDWDNVTFPMRESEWKKRGIKEAITIRKAGTRALNRDEGRHLLPRVYDTLLLAAPPSGKKH